MKTCERWPCTCDLWSRVGIPSARVTHLAKKRQNWLCSPVFRAEGTYRCSLGCSRPCLTVLPTGLLDEINHWAEKSTSNASVEESAELSTAWLPLHQVGNLTIQTLPGHKQLKKAAHVSDMVRPYKMLVLLLSVYPQLGQPQASPTPDSYD